MAKYSWPTTKYFYLALMHLLSSVGCHTDQHTYEDISHHGIISYRVAILYKYSKINIFVFTDPFTHQIVQMRRFTIFFLEQQQLT